MSEIYGNFETKEKQKAFQGIQNQRFSKPLNMIKKIF